MFYPAFVGLFVCPLAALRKITDRIFRYILPETYLWTMKSWLNFGQRRRQDLLRGGAKLGSRSWCTHGGLQGRVQQLIDD